MKSITVKCPASLSNLVCGYDIFGMALREPYDTLELCVAEKPGITIEHIDNYGLSNDPEKNIAGVSLQALMNDHCADAGFTLKINKQIKPGSGLGSSAASAAGPVVAANKLLNLNLSKQQMLSYAMEGELMASGTRHADNLAPLIYGGLCLIRDAASFDIIGIPSPSLFVTVLHPQIEIKTSYAREILPKQIALTDAVKQWANTAGMIAGFMSNDYELIRRSMVDYIVEPVRSALIPKFSEVKESCLREGVLGGGISGSGPSLFMFSKDKETALQAEVSMKKIYDTTGLDYKTYVTTVNNHGVSVH